MTPREIESLLVHEPFVRAVAHALLAGDPRVDDVVQETWLAALKDRPRSPEKTRFWLAAIVRNLSRSALRRDATRARHREKLARQDAVPSTEEIAAKEEIRGQVLDALLALEEPYRDALLLRYYEDLPPREIAKRLDLPVETVRTRVKRGLQRLRGELDRRHGGQREAWGLALLPLALKHRVPTAGVTGAGAALLARLMAASRASRAALLVVAIGIGVTLTVALATRASRPEPAERAAPTHAEEALAPLSAEREDMRAPLHEPDTVGLRGVVIGWGARPQPGAIVNVFDATESFYVGWSGVTRILEEKDPPRRLLASGVCDEEGRFELRVERGRPVALRAGHEGALSADVGELDTDRDLSGVVLQLERGAWIVGVVVDPENRPLQGAKVRPVRGWDSVRKKPRLEARTDAEGRFALGPLVPDSCALLVQCPGHAPRLFHGVPAPGLGVRVQLSKGHTVVGRVLARPTLHPVAEAKVTVIPVNDSYAPVTTYTDAFGNFALGPVGPDGKFRFNLAANGFEAGYTILSEEVLTEGATLDVEVGPTQTIRGRAFVRGPDGSERAAARVRLAIHAYAGWTAGIWYAGPHAGQRVTTGEDGSFEIGGVSIEKAVISVDADDSRYGIDPSVPQDGGGIMLKGEQDDVVSIPLVERKSIVGRVVDAGGAPVEGAEVSANWGRLRTRTGADGQFRLRAISPRSRGKLVLSAHARGLGTGQAEYENGPPVEEVELALRPSVWIEGVVQDGAGKPLAQVRVTTEPLRSPGPGLAYTDAKGRYRFEWPGKKRPRAAFVLHGFQVAVAELADPPEPVVLVPALSLNGVVRTEQGEPVANAYLRATQAGSGAKAAPGRTAQTDGEGRFSIGDLSAGDWHLNAWASGHLNPTYRLVLLDAESPDLELTVASALEIRGRVLDLEGLPVAKARVEVRHLEERQGAGTRGEAWSDRNGEFRIAGVRDGQFLLRARASRKVFDSIEGVEAGSQRVLLREVLPVTLSGRVRLPEGADPLKAVVHLYREDRRLLPASRRSWSDPAPRRCSCSEEGRWEAKGLVGSSFTVWVEHPELAAPVRRGVKSDAEDVEFELDAGATIEGTVAGDEGPLTIRAEAMDGRGPTRAVGAEKSGRFRLTGLARGVSYRLSASNSEWTWKAERESVEPGATGVVLRMEPVEEKDG